MLTNSMPHIEALLQDPSSDVSLDELRSDLNELAKLRQGARVAFCKRLALAYLLIVGHRPSQGVIEPKTKDFFKWCERLRTANNKPYSTGTLRTYLTVGFAINPEKLVKDQARTQKRRDEMMRKLGGGLVQAVESGTKVVSITKLKRQHGLPSNVAAEVNALMDAWDNASIEARGQFIYHVTGARLKTA